MLLGNLVTAYNAATRPLLDDILAFAPCEQYDQSVVQPATRQLLCGSSIAIRNPWALRRWMVTSTSALLLRNIDDSQLAGCIALSWLDTVDGY